MKFFSLLTGELAGSGSGKYTERKNALPLFWQFILKTKANRRYLAVAAAGTIIQFIVFKMLYPFPDFISDSYSYIATNIYHMDVNLWPIGYSKFLLFVHNISHSDTLLVAVQYFLLEAAMAYFFYTILYLFQPGKATRIILFIFLFFNPLVLYLSNCVLSDAIFTALTMVFLAQFLWMFHQPMIKQLVIQGVIIGIAFTLRYTAMYYPLVAITGFILSRQTVRMKILGSVLGLALMYPFYQYTKVKTKAITGTAEFSVFGGWQIANNALYMYGHINVDSNRLPFEMRPLDRTAKDFFKQFHPSDQELAELPGTYFIKVPYAILKPYMNARYSYDNPTDQFKTWGSVSPLYNAYGTWLVTHYPISFIRYYLLLNTKNYFKPHLEKFGSYNLLVNTVPSHVQDWFDYTTPFVHSASPTFQGKLFYIFPSAFMVLNIYFIGFMLWSLFTGRFKQLNYILKKSLLFSSLFLVVNFGFSILATPVVLRYQIIPMIVLVTFSALLMERGNKPFAAIISKKR